MKKLLLVFFFALARLLTLAQPGTFDPTFNPTDAGFGIGEGANGTVYAAALQDDGKILIAGGFTAYNGSSRGRIARLNAAGTLDSSFVPGTGTNGTVYAMAVQSDGKILIGGAFTLYNGQACNRIARLNSDGSLDATFNAGSGANSAVRAIALQSDGNILAGGDFTTFDGAGCGRIVRLNSNGSLDATFTTGSGAGNTINTIVVQSDNKILVGGKFTTYNSIVRNHIARLNSNGTLDNTFYSGIYDGGEVNSIALQSDGKVLIGGIFYAYSAYFLEGIVRLNTNGSLDATFNSIGGANNVIYSMALQKDGKILIAGAFTAYGGTSRNRLARLNATGTLDLSFDPGRGSNETCNATAIQSDGKILLGGSFTTYGNAPKFRITRVNSNGAPDTSFNTTPQTGATSYVLTTATQPDGKILIGGRFTSYNGTTCNRIARLHPDGSMDNSFNMGGVVHGETNSIAVQKDGKIVVGGWFSTTTNNAVDSSIMRLNPDGSPDATFTRGRVNGIVYSTIVQDDGKILVGGMFSNYNGTRCNGIARLNADGSLDTSFQTGSGIDGDILFIMPQDDGKIIIAGAFVSYNGVPRNSIARLNADGSLDLSFDSGSATNIGIFYAAQQSDGKLVIGGSFTSYNGTTCNRIARLHPDGSLDTSFNTGSGMNGIVYFIAIQSGDKILVGGKFSSYNGSPQGGIIRLNSDGTPDVTFNTGTGINGGFITTMAFQNDGKIIIAGEFTSYNGKGRNRVARLHGGTLTTSTPATGMYCQGSAISVPYTVTGTYNTGNVFTAQLSDATGSFASPVNIGTLSSTTSGVITATIPANTPAGNSYRVRAVVEAAGVISADNGSNLVINPLPATPTITAASTTSFCQGGSVSLTSSLNTGNQWYHNGVAINGATAQTYTATQGGSYTVVTTINDCASPASATTVVIVTPLPAKPVITQTGNTLNSSAATGNQWYLNGVAISGATNQNYQVQAAGMYTVQTTQNNCSILSDPLNFVSTAIASPSTWNGEVYAYPNPVARNLYIKNNGSRKLDMQLVDALGKVVYRANITTATATIEMAGQPSGVYRLLVTDTNKQQTISINVIKY